MSATNQMLRISSQPALLALFREWCAQHRSEENIEFWCGAHGRCLLALPVPLMRCCRLEVQRYKKVADVAERRRLGQMVVGQYINAGATQELNLDQVRQLTRRDCTYAPRRTCASER